MKHIKPEVEQAEKNIQGEKPKKAPLREAQREREEAMDEDGAPMAPKKKKRTMGVVALKHKRVLDNVGKNVRKHQKSLYQSMIDEGYSVSYAKRGGVGMTKSWEKLLDERLGDDKLSNIHAQLAVAKKLDYMLFVHEIKDEDIYELMDSVLCVPKKIIHGVQGTHVWFWSPDNLARDKALDKAYKLRGKYAAEKIEVGTGISSMSDADLADLIKMQKKRFLKKD